MEKQNISHSGTDATPRIIDNAIEASRYLASIHDCSDPKTDACKGMQWSREQYIHVLGCCSMEQSSEERNLIPGNTRVQACMTAHCWLGIGYGFGRTRLMRAHTTAPPLHQETQNHCPLHCLCNHPHRKTLYSCLEVGREELQIPSSIRSFSSLTPFMFVSLSMHHEVHSAYGTYLITASCRPRCSALREG